MSKSLYAAFGTVKNYEQNGVVLDFGVARFRVRRAGGSNRAFQSVLSSKLRPHRRAFEAGVLDNDTAARIYMEVYFESVVLGWENVTDEHGNALEYTKDNFVKVMTDLPDLWDTLRSQCEDMRNFQAEEVSKDGSTLGNS